MKLRPVDPIETHAGFTKDGDLHLDLFMYLRKDQDFCHDLVSYSKFTAVYDPEFNWEILLKKNQATKLGIDLSKFHKSPHTGTYENQKILTSPIIVESIMPIMRNSELKVYKFNHPIQTVQMINIDEDDPEKQDRVIIGRRFLTFFRLIISEKMKEAMGKCGENTFVFTADAADFEFWEGKIEDLGVYQALHESGKSLMIGDLTFAELKKTITRDKNLIYHEKIIEAQYLLSKEIEKLIDPKDKHRKNSREQFFLTIFSSEIITFTFRTPLSKYIKNCKAKFI